MRGRQSSRRDAAARQDRLGESRDPRASDVAAAVRTLRAHISRVRRRGELQPDERQALADLLERMTALLGESPDDRDG